MSRRTLSAPVTSKKFILGSKSFAAITAIEGLKLPSKGAERLKKTAARSQAERIAATIQAFAATRPRG